MRHRKVTTGKLGRTQSHRKALMRNLAMSLFEHESIITTKAKARALRKYSEKIITLAKRGDSFAHRLVFKEIKRKDIVKKLFDTIRTRFEDRPGGYTRVYNLYPRRGDNAEMVKIELVAEESAPPKKEAKSKKGKKQKALKKSGDTAKKKAKTAETGTETKKKVQKDKPVPDETTLKADETSPDETTLKTDETSPDEPPVGSAEQPEQMDSGDTEDAGADSPEPDKK